VKERVADGRVLSLSGISNVKSQISEAGVLEEAKGWQPTERGTPQGGVISPLLANIYLDPLDHQMEQAGWAMVRYADDFVILCRSEAEAQAALAAKRPPSLEPAVTCLRKDSIAELQARLIESNSLIVVLLDRPGGQMLGVVTLHDLLRAHDRRVTIEVPKPTAVWWNRL